MEDVCENLDELTLQFFENLESLQKKRHVLCDLIRDGHLKLSMARYSMGNKAVSSLQFSHKMDHALYHVENDEGLNGFGFHKVNPGELLSSTSTSNGDKPEENTALRRRKPRNPGEEKDDEESSKVEDIGISAMLESVKLDRSSDENSKVQKVQDPIKWFGVLVPSSLREGQKKFQTAIELCCEIATLEAELRQVVVKFEHLKEKKRLLRENKEDASLS